MRIRSLLVTILVVGSSVIPRLASGEESASPAVGPSINAFRSLSDSAPEPDDDEIKEKLERMTYLLGLDPERFDLGVSSSGPKKELKITVVGDRALSLDEAITNLRRLVRDNASPEAIRAFEQSKEYARAADCSAAAIAALLERREVAAVAALLRARELDPDNPEHTLNLAGVASRLGLPRHALALIAAVEKAGRPFAVAAGLNPRAVLLNNRGNALLQTKRFADAEQVLREVVRLEPGLREPYLNLAHALYQQKTPEKQAEAMRFYRVSYRPVPPVLPKPPDSSLPPSTEPPATPPPPTPEQLATEEQREADLQAERRGRPSPYVIFDMSRGKRGGLPTIKVPRTIADGQATLVKVDQLLEELMAKSETITHKMQELDEKIRARERSGEIPRISAQRAQDVYWYIGHLEIHPRLRELLGKAQRAGEDPGVGSYGGQWENPWGSEELQKEHDRIRESSMPHDQKCAAMWAVTEPYHGSWQGPIRQLDHALNLLAHEAYPYMTAIASNLSDPMHREYARLTIEFRMIGWSLELVQNLRIVCRWDDTFVDMWGARDGEGTAGDVEEGDMPPALSCPSFLSGEFKVKASVEVAEVSVNCEKVGLELSTPGWVKAFAEVERNYTGETSLFVGGATEVSTGFEVGPSLGMKSGFYLAFDKDGNFSSFGTKYTTSAAFNVGPLGYEREIENSFALISAPAQ